MGAILGKIRHDGGAAMCEHDDLDEFARRSGELTRRQFGAMALSAGLVAALPKVADAAETHGADVEIKTPDGVADAYFVHPAKGKHAGVLIWPDIFGLRPAFKDMATRLAESGYSVLVINPFYRTKKAPTAPDHPDFNDPATRQSLMALAGTLNPDTAVTDAKAFVAFLDSQASVDKRRKLGTTGYCMGGPFVLRAAATFPDRVGAGATFHGGGLVTDKPDSPHLLIPQMKAHFLIAIAENDDKKQPEAKDVLRDSFAKAHLPAEVEVYAGTMHGWCPPDSQVYNHDQAEKAWSRMLALFSSSLA
jgi:carboxymethylenebutenolidase